MGLKLRFPRLRLRSPGANPASRRRTARLESLEQRSLLTTVPWGAAVDDTAEYLVGDVHVNVVFLESNGQIDPSTENWSPAQIDAVKQKVVEGVNWWKTQLDDLDTVHELDFHFDFTYADQPFATKYEPISRVSQDFRLWVGEFLDSTGFGNLAPGDAGISKGIRAFNHQQRVESGSNWGFTIFVVDDDADVDDRFAMGSDFSRAFAFAGGRFLVAPAGRPASAFAHEMGHIFYALDEHSSGSSYFARRGYYDTQNLNAHVGHPDPASRVVSIMDGHGEAYPVGAISPSAREMVGWRDSDGDGIFDVLDVPLSLTGSGAIDPATGKFRFVGQAAVGVLQNLNQSSLQSDITINEVSRVQYRIDGGAWNDAVTPHAPEVDLDFSFAVPAGNHTIEIRALDDATNGPGETGVMSAIFQGSTTAPSATALPGINGFLWNDLDGDGVHDSNEGGLANWTVEVRGPSGQVLDLQQQVEPDDYLENQIVTSVHSGVKLSASGTDLLTTLAHVASGPASTGTKVFSHQLPSTTGEANWSTEWIGVHRELLMEFTEPVTTLSIDVIGVGQGSFGRLAIFDANGNLIERVTTGVLADGEVATLTLSRPTATIKSARAYGHAGAPVALDNLRFGPATIITTDANGAWSAPYLESGNFRIQVASPSGWSATTADGASQAVALAAGATVQNVSFGFNFAAPPWHNEMEPTDVNRDGAVTLADLLTVVQYLRSQGFGQLSGEPEEADPLIDVNGDRQLTLADLMEVVDALRQHLNGGSGEGEASTAGLSGAAAGYGITAPAPEGETVSPLAVDAFPGFTTTPSHPASFNRTEDEQLPPILSLAPDRGSHDCGEDHEHAAAETSSVSLAALRSRSPLALEDALSDIAGDIAQRWPFGGAAGH